jgi:hypothetical protein
MRIVLFPARKKVYHIPLSPGREPGGCGGATIFNLKHANAKRAAPSFRREELTDLADATLFIVRWQQLSVP